MALFCWSFLFLSTFLFMFPRVQTMLDSFLISIYRKLACDFPTSWFIMPWKCCSLSKLYFYLWSLSWHSDSYFYCFIDTLHGHLVDLSNPVCPRLNSSSSFFWKEMGLPISVNGESVLPIAQREKFLESSLFLLFIFHLTLSIPITLSNSIFKYSKSVLCLLMLSNSESLASFI